jgi:hypothetical protein
VELTKDTFKDCWKTQQGSFIFFTVINQGEAFPNLIQLNFSLYSLSVKGRRHFENDFSRTIKKGNLFRTLGWTIKIPAILGSENES